MRVHGGVMRVWVAVVSMMLLLIELLRISIRIVWLWGIHGMRGIMRRID